MRSWCRSADNPAWHSACILYVQKCGNKWSVASLQTWLRMLLLQLWVGRLSRLKEEWSYSWRFWIFKSSGVLNKQILSNSLLECLPAWPHLLNDGSPNQCVCSQHDLERNWVLPKLPSLKIRIDQRRKLKHIKTEKRDICWEKILSLISYLLSLSVSCADWLLFLRLDPTADAWIDRKADFTKFVLVCWQPVFSLRVTRT